MGKAEPALPVRVTLSLDLKDLVPTALPSMNQLLQTFLIFVTGLLGGLIGSVLLSDPGSTAETQDAESSYSTEANLELAESHDALQAQVDTLSRTVELQSSTILNLQDQVKGAVEMERALREGVMPGGEPLPPGLAMADVPTGPGFDAAVDAIIPQREEQEESERAERREERRQEQLARRVDDLAEQLGLDEAQKGEFAKILDESSKARNDFFQEMRETGAWSDRETIRTKMTEMRESELQSLGGLLNPEQLSQYEESTSFTGFGGGGNRGGGGGGGNRGGGNNNGGGRGF